MDIVIGILTILIFLFALLKAASDENNKIALRWIGEGMFVGAFVAIGTLIVLGVIPS